MSLENQRIGRQGEKLFSLLCTEAGVTCNKSTEDDFGWDMLIEFPPHGKAQQPIDLRPVQLAASVQVKATKARARSCRISLQNALRLAKSPLPSFVFLAVLRDGRAPRYFVVHVWEELIQAWLKAARLADAREVTALNKEHVAINFYDYDEHTGDALAWMRNEILAVGPNYTTRKLRFANTVGFENGYGIANISLEVSPQDFVDLQLGLRPLLRAKRIQLYSERFGIRSARPELDLQDVELSLRPEGVPVVLRFRFGDGRCIAIEAMLYHAVGSEPGENTAAWRVSARCFDVVFSAKRMSARANLKADEVLPFDDVALFAALQAAPPSAVIRVEVEVAKRTIDFGTINHDKQRLPGSWDGVDQAFLVLRNMTLGAAKPLPQLALSQLETASLDLSVLTALAGDRRMLLKFTPNPDAPKKFKCLLAYASATIGDLCFAAVVRRSIASDRRRGGRRQIYFGSPTILRSYVETDATRATEAMRRDYETLLDDLSGDGEVMAVGDLRSMVSREEQDQEIRSDLPLRREQIS